MAKVFIVNKSSHDFSAAEKFGTIVFLSEGPMNRYATNSMFRLFDDGLKESKPEDYIVPCSLNVMNSIACAIFAHKHGTLNLLLFKEGAYIERNHIFTSIKSLDNEHEDMVSLFNNSKGEKANDADLRKNPKALEKRLVKVLGGEE